MEIIEKCRLPLNFARALAVRQKWFTCADCEQYERWLQLCDSYENMTILDIFDISDYAVQFSDISEYPDRKTAVESFMYIISAAAFRTFEIQEYEKLTIF